MANLLIASLLIAAVIGLSAGYLSFLVLSPGAGLSKNLIVGVLGAVVGTGLLSVLGDSSVFKSPWLSAFLTSTVGTVIALLILRLARR